MSLETLEATLNDLSTRLQRLEKRRRRPARATRPRKLSEARDTLLNSKALAAAMNVSASFILAMKRAGYRFTNGHQTTIESALAWRAAFPGFRTRFYLQKDWDASPKLTLPSSFPEKSMTPTDFQSPNP